MLLQHVIGAGVIGLCHVPPAQPSSLLLVTGPLSAPLPSGLALLRFAGARPLHDAQTRTNLRRSARLYLRRTLRSGGGNPVSSDSVGGASAEPHGEVGGGGGDGGGGGGPPGTQSEGEAALSGQWKKEEEALGCMWSYETEEPESFC